MLAHCKPCAGFVLWQWGCTPAVGLHWDSLFWLIYFEVVTLGPSLSLQNWEIILWPGLWIERSHRQVARITTCGRDLRRRAGEEGSGWWQHWASHDAVACLQGSSEGLGGLEKHCDDSTTEAAEGLIQMESLTCLLGNKCGFCLKLSFFFLSFSYILYRIITRNALVCALTVKEWGIALATPLNHNNESVSE